MHGTAHPVPSTCGVWLSCCPLRGVPAAFDPAASSARGIRWDPRRGSGSSGRAGALSRVWEGWEHTDVGQEASKARLVCDRIHWAASSASSRTRGRKRCSFPRSPGGQADGCTHTRIHPSLSHPAIPAHFERSIWVPLCSCWHKTTWLLWGRIPLVLEISLQSSSLSPGNSLRSWRISFVFLCFPFPFRAEGNGTAFSQAAMELHPHWAAPLSFQPSSFTLCTSGRVQMWLDRSAVSAQTHMCCFMHLLLPSPGR